MSERGTHDERYVGQNRSITLRNGKLTGAVVTGDKCGERLGNFGIKYHRVRGLTRTVFFFGASWTYYSMRRV